MKTFHLFTSICTSPPTQLPFKFFIYPQINLRFITVCSANPSELGIPAMCSLVFYSFPVFVCMCVGHLLMLFKVLICCISVDWLLVLFLLLSLPPLPFFFFYSFFFLLLIPLLLLPYSLVVLCFIFYTTLFQIPHTL